MTIGMERRQKYAGTTDPTGCGENSAGNRPPEAGGPQGGHRGGERSQSPGDLSENFEYYAAKREKNQNESRIRYLERVLKTAEIITDHSGEDEVGLDNTVTLYVEEDDVEETYRLVTSIRGNSLEGLISTESPIGKAIMGHKVGDRVLVQVNDQYGYYVEIRKMRKPATKAETESEATDRQPGTRRGFKTDTA